MFASYTAAFNWTLTGSRTRVINVFLLLTGKPVVYLFVPESVPAELLFDFPLGQSPMVSKWPSDPTRRESHDSDCLREVMRGGLDEGEKQKTKGNICQPTAPTHNQLKMP